MKRRDILKLSVGLCGVPFLGLPKQIQFPKKQTTPLTKQPVVMGIDQDYVCGPLLRCEIQSPFFTHPKRFIIGLNSDLDYIMRKEQIDLCVIDEYPGAKLTRDFASRFPQRVVRCRYKKPGNFVLIIDEAQDRVSACRQYWFTGSHPEAYCRIAHQILEDRGTGLHRLPTLDSRI